MVDGGRQAVLVHAAAHGGVALWVKVDQQDTLAELCQRCGEVDGGGGFADTAFLIGHTEDFGHGCAFSFAQGLWGIGVILTKCRSAFSCGT